jgi:hypothetical protein
MPSKADADTSKLDELCEELTLNCDVAEAQSLSPAVLITAPALRRLLAERASARAEIEALKLVLHESGRMRAEADLEIAALKLADAKWREMACDFHDLHHAHELSEKELEEARAEILWLEAALREARARLGE